MSEPDLSRFQKKMDRQKQREAEIAAAREKAKKQAGNDDFWPDTFEFFGHGCAWVVQIILLLFFTFIGTFLFAPRSGQYAEDVDFPTGFFRSCVVVLLICICVLLYRIWLLKSQRPLDRRPPAAQTDPNNPTA